MLYCGNIAPTNPNICKQIKEMLEGTSYKKGVHWDTFRKKFIDTGACSNDVLISCMNSILRPNGPVSGVNNIFWNGLPFDPEIGH